jgi:hypothetical protein
MSKEVEALGEKVKSLELDLKSLTDKMNDIKETEKIKRMLKDQERGAFKSLVDVLKVIAAIIFLITAGNKATDTPEMNKTKVDWIESLIK